MNATIRVVYDRLPTIEVREHTEDERGNIFTVLRSFSVCGIIVPAGFQCDGASVPRFLWGLVFPRNDKQAMCAAIIHDFIYRTHPAHWDRAEADETFHCLLLEGGVSWIRALRAYIGVRLFGKSAWEAGNK